MPRTQFLKALSVQEAAYQGFTHLFVLRPGVELTESTAGLAQTLKLGSQRVGEVIRRSVVSPITPFADVSDAAFLLTTLTVKTLTSAGADKVVLHAALELNVNGTEITTDQVNNTPTTAAVAGDTLVAVVTPTAAKKLSDLDQGLVHVYFEISAPIQLREAVMQPLGMAVMAAEGAEAQATAVDYDSKTVAELKELAKARGVEVSSDMRKDELIEALEEAETAKA